MGRIPSLVLAAALAGVAPSCEDRHSASGVVPQAPLQRGTKADLYYMQTKSAGALPRNARLVCFFDGPVGADDYLVLAWEKEPPPGFDVFRDGAPAETCMSFAGSKPLCLPAKAIADEEKRQLTFRRGFRMTADVYLPTGRIDYSEDTNKQNGTCRRVTDER